MNGFFQRDDYTGVISECDYLLNNYEKRRDIYFVRGLGSYFDGKYEDALESFDLALRLPSVYPKYESERSRDIFYYMGTTHWKLGHFSIACSMFDKAIECDYGHGIMASRDWTVARSLYYRGTHFAIKGMFSEAMSDLMDSRELLKKCSDPFHEIVNKQLEKVKKAMEKPTDSNSDG